ncbi:MAG: outer membrane beta-barrel protein [Negativicutes bacterium]|jgi:hypothetical protein
MTKTISHADCENAAIQTARRDAIEKAGLVFINSVTVVENSQVVKDEIKASIKAVILNQDYTNGYGKPKYVANDDFGKYTVKVRVLVQNTSDYNPYRNIAAVNNYENTDATVVPFNIPVQASSGRTIQQPVSNNTLVNSNRRSFDGWVGLGYGLISGSSSTIYWTSPVSGNRSYVNNFQRGELSGLALEGGINFNDYFGVRANFSYYESKGDIYSQSYNIWLSNGSLNVSSYKIAAQLIAACTFDEIKPYIGVGAGANITATTLANYGSHSSDLPNTGSTSFYLPISAGVEWKFARDAGAVVDYTYNYDAVVSSDQFTQLAPQSQFSLCLRWYF